MPYTAPRVTLEIYEQELGSLVRLVLLDCEGDEDVVNAIVFAPARDRWNMSPAELLRKGLYKEAYEVARDNFLAVKRVEPIQLSRAPRLHQRKGQSKGRS